MSENPSQSEPKPPGSLPGPGLLSNLRIVSLGTLVSRILGMLRDMAMASMFGASTILDAFIIAFRIPNLARQLLGEGALTTAFLPVFVRTREQHGPQAARESMTAVAVSLFFVLLVLVVLGEVILAVAWSATPHDSSSRLLILLTMIMLPYMLVICLAGLFCAALHALREFVWPVTVPIVLNAVWLIGVGVAAFSTQIPVTRATIAAVAVVISGGLQLAIPLIALHWRGMGLAPGWRSELKVVPEIFRGVFPVLVGMSLLQVSAILDSLIAWGFSRPDDGSLAWCQIWNITPVLESGTTSALYIGQRLYQFPLGIFGIALGTVLFPTLTQHAQRGEMDHFRADLSRGLRIMLSLGLPASAGLIVFAWPLTLALFQRGHFTESDSVLTSRMIATYGAGVWSFIGIAIINRAYYSLSDRVTPMRYGFLTLAINLCLTFSLIWSLGGVGMALSSVLANMLQVVLTSRTLHQRIGPLDWPAILATAWKALVATGMMSVASVAVLAILPVPVSLTTKLIYLGVPMMTGAVTYVLAARLLSMKDFFEFLRSA